MFVIKPSSMLVLKQVDHVLASLEKAKYAHDCLRPLTPEQQQQYQRIEIELKQLRESVSI